MKQLRTAIERIAEQNVSILIQGESGTGKELVAKAVHDHSVRRDASHSWRSTAARFPTR